MSFWKNPLPLQEFATSEVVIYFYNNGWVPITYYSLKEAIALYYKIKQKGEEIFIFPSHAKPTDL